MGDALQAVQSVTEDNNVLAFVGDGAKLLVPDILPASSSSYTARIDQQCFDIFLLNGGRSVINAHQEGRLARRGGRRMTLVNLLEPDSGRVTVR